TPSTGLAPDLPDFLFAGWRLRSADISEAQARDELQGWTVSTLCSTYLKYQLDRHERQLQQVRNCHKAGIN
ncbi:MAG: hypothetical protein Q9168_006841, partial [Polycauliona sp. 1 TL-2023]